MFSRRKKSVEEAWEQVTTREAFGKKISKFEGVSFPLAEAETYIEAAKLLCYKTLWLRDQGQPHTAEAAMCKWWAPKFRLRLFIIVYWRMAMADTARITLSNNAYVMY